MRVLGIPCFGQIHAERQDVFGVVARIYAGKIREASDQQTPADQKNDGQGNLSHHQDSARLSGRGQSPPFLQRLGTFVV